MKKQAIIVATVAVTLLGAGGSVALVARRQAQPVDLKPSAANVASAPQPVDTQGVAAPTSAPATSAAIQPTASTPATSTTATTTQPMTVDQLQAEAAAHIMAQPNAVQAYVGCFDEIIQRRYQWQLTETEMLHRLDSLQKTYTNLCVAQHLVDSYPLSQTPPGFRD